MSDLHVIGRMKKLNNQNYTTWQTCMKFYLQGQDLWNVVGSSEVTPPEDAGALKKWKIKVGMATGRVGAGAALPAPAPPGIFSPHIRLIPRLNRGGSGSGSGSGSGRGRGRKGLFELPRDHHRELEAELKKMAPPNGRAVLVFRARCGCSVGRMEVPGPKKSRKVKK
ncbi:Uncharacterized protein Adt_28065 [Abeliophyllum distichum]|uniref:DUF4219 domain-containing protein n=1 Tax=Abeliophyllum distichum TaxID=126358 RepID=A0ABD1RVK4_9LAMI